MSADDQLDISLMDDDEPEASNGNAGDDVVLVTDSEVDRYNTFTLIRWWKQEVVRGATVLVVGAGALGNEVLKNLALMGVGRIVIVDFDTIEKANLSRSILFRERHNQQKKAEVAAAAAREINPDVAVRWLHTDITHGLGLGVYRRVDAVIGCLDNREARLAINRACWYLNKPWVDGGLHEMSGLVRVFWPGQGACYQCTLTDRDYGIMAMRESCALLAHAGVLEGKVPTTPTIASIIAAFEVQEALKLIHGMPVKPGQALVVDGMGMESFEMIYEEDAECPSHWVYDEIIELPQARAATTTLAEMLALAREQLGETAQLTIPLFVNQAQCPNDDCVGYEVDLRQPLHTLNSEIATCPQCGTGLNLMPYVDRITGAEDFLDLTLADAGIPPLDVVVASTPDHHYAFLELSGDADSVFQFEGPTVAVHDISPVG